jgi:hypothetical protein
MSPIGRGNGLKPVWKENGRVRVDHRFLWLWDPTLGRARAKGKERPNEGIFPWALGSFFLEAAEMVSYDLTSSYVEGEGPEDPSLSLVIARDQRGGNRQILF